MVVVHRLSCSMDVGSSQIRDWTCVSCISRWIPNHWTTTETLPLSLNGRESWKLPLALTGSCVWLLPDSKLSPTTQIAFISSHSSLLTWSSTLSLHNPCLKLSFPNCSFTSYYLWIYLCLPASLKVRTSGIVELHRPLFPLSLQSSTKLGIK